MQNLFPNPASQILDQISHARLDTAIFQLSKEHEPPGSASRSGGVIALLTINMETHVASFATTSVGHPPSDKIAVFGKNASEKVARLRDRRFKGNADVVSSTSANNVDTYGGGVFFTRSSDNKEIYNEEVYISISGARPEVDEALAFAIGEMLGFKTPEYDNPLIPRARELLVM